MLAAGWRTRGDLMRRREFIALLGGAAAEGSVLWPLAARAQQAERVRRIGVMVSGAENDPEMKARLAAIGQGLARFGWPEGRNVQIDSRYAFASAERAQVMAKELVALQPDVILAFGSFTTRALQRETNAIPIVFVGVPDPVGDGFIVSLARPGGNLTGTLLNEPSVVGKWLAMLKEIAPHVSRVVLMANPKTGPFDYFVRSAKAKAVSLGIEIVPAPIADAADIERTIESLADARNSGLILPPDSTTLLNRDRIIGLAARYRLPAVYSWRFFVAAGGLMSYGTDAAEQNRQAASYIDRILRGAKPADLPVQAPTKYQTTINLKTAKALGLTVPPGLLVAADEVFE